MPAAVFPRAKVQSTIMTERGFDDLRRTVVFVDELETRLADTMITMMMMYRHLLLLALKLIQSAWGGINIGLGTRRPPVVFVLQTRSKSNRSRLQAKNMHWAVSYNVSIHLRHDRSMGVTPMSNPLPGCVTDDVLFVGPFNGVEPAAPD